jgi:hypothetical protein
MDLRARVARPLIAGFILAASLWIGILPVAAGGSTIVSHQQLKLLFPGSFQAFAMGLIKADISASSDGLLTVKTSRTTEHGRWSIQAGKLCIVLERTLKGEKKCSRVLLQGGWYRTTLVIFKKANAVVAN